MNDLQERIKLVNRGLTVYILYIYINFSLKMAQYAPKHVGEKEMINVCNELCMCITCTSTIRYLLTYLLTPRCRVLLQKLTGLQLVKKLLTVGVSTILSASSSGAWRRDDADATVDTRD